MPGYQQAIGIKGLKPFVKNTGLVGTPSHGFPKTAESELPDQLIRVRRVQDTYTCLDPTNCTGSNVG